MADVLDENRVGEWRNEHPRRLTAMRPTYDAELAILAEFGSRGLFIVSR